MKHLILGLALCASGCSTTNVTKFVSAVGKAQANDHKVVVILANTPYGPVRMLWMNPGTTNTSPFVVKPDGTIEVGRSQ